jgi:hypothetical protein
MFTDRLVPASRATALALVLGIALAGCRFFTEPGHDTLTLELDADTPTTVRTITSNNFVFTFDQDGNEVFHLFQSDSAWVELPHRAEFDLRQAGMYYIRVAEAEDPDAVVHMRVLLDGRQSYEIAAPIEGVGLQYYYLGH